MKPYTHTLEPDEIRPSRVCENEAMVSKIFDVSCTAGTIAEKIFLVYYFTA
ncbi:hypothetical protein A2U01_0037149, partial [Trifolium medium]|nr:hypothetical protein [Trifolium medium]